MNPRTLPPDADALANYLAALDDELLAVKDTSVAPDTDVPDAIREQLEGEVECLQLLRWRFGSGAAADRAVPAALAPASIGRFRIVGELGHGGNGVVFLAHDPLLGRDVALKVPRTEALVTPELRLRFQREAKAAALLDHPHIAAVYEAGEAGPITYIAAAYCRGPTLDQWIAQQAGPIDVRAAAELVTALARGVQHAHSRGVLHRDLKPSNVILTPGSAVFTPKITDFGLAKLLESPDSPHTRTGAILGTPNYMAPEQAAGRTADVTTAVDVFALGAILYELLAGRPPFAAESALQTLRLVESQEPQRPSRLRPHVPLDLETIALKCLEKDPRRRYATADALADDLQRFLAGEPVEARPVRCGERVVRWARRNPLPAVLTAAVVLLAIGLAGGGVYFAFARRKMAVGDAEQPQRRARLCARVRRGVANAQGFERLRHRRRRERGRATNRRRQRGFSHVCLGRRFRAHDSQAGRPSKRSSRSANAGRGR